MAITQKSLIDSVPTKLLIGGAWREASSGERFEVHDPSTGATLTTCADGTPEDGLAALAAAHEAQAGWAATPPRDRSEILRRAFETVVARADEFATLMTLEMGKTVAEARGEVTYGAEFFRWFAEEAVRIHGRYSVAPNGASRLLTMKQPVGPTLMITPWNFPLAMGTRKIGPAVAAGCTMVVKPAHETPLTMLLLAQVMQESGLPDGVLNVVTTMHSGAVCEPVIRDERLRKLTFTGSTGVGRTLVEQSAEQLLRVSMELGGNAPFLVFADADLDAALDGAMIAKMRNAGEACTAANRFYVESSVAEEFGRRLAQRMAKLSVGPGTAEDNQVGPLINAAAVEKVHGLVTDAVARGARTLIGAQRPERPGFYYDPTVLMDVTADADILGEEIFGPVAPIVRFDDEQQAIRLANATEYGLVSYVYTGDLARGLRVSEQLETGMVGLNRGLVSDPAAPFGGVKQSGIGREGGHEGVLDYLESKYIAVQW
jgi:succinate-semialdehyde dehydrogenase / glutarate-semialdehyde dehydrogenase